MMTTELAVKGNDRELPLHERDRLCAWLTDLKIDPRDVRAMAVIRVDDHYELHLSEFLRTDTGGIQIDLALEVPVTRPRVIQLGTRRDTWPRVRRVSP